MAADDTIESWIDAEIAGAEAELGMLRTYNKQKTADFAEVGGRLQALRDVRAKMLEHWQTYSP